MTFLRRIRLILAIAIFSGAASAAALAGSVPDLGGLVNNSVNAALNAGLDTDLTPMPGVAIPCVTGWGISCYDATVTPSINTLRKKLALALIGASTGTGTASATQVVTASGTRTIGGTASFDSLTGYFENVWWPKYVQLTQMEADERNKVATTGMAADANGANADHWVNYDQDVKKAEWDIQKGYAGAESVLCPSASMGQSQLLHEFLTRQTADQISAKRGLERAGAKGQTPKTENGPADNFVETVKQLNQTGVCIPEGNAGSNAQWCTSSKAALKGAHISTTKFMDSFAMSTNTSDPSNQTYIDMLQKRIYPYVFSPIRPELLKPNANGSIDTAAAEMIVRQDTFNAILDTFEYPFTRLRAEKQPQSGTTSEQFLKTALQQMGITDNSLMSKILGDSGVSQEGADFVIYQGYNSDPKTLIDTGTWGTDNLLRMIMTTNMEQVTLMYQVREQLKTTNMILGAIGSVMAKPQYDELQAKLSGLAAGH